jgi:hypothetical protein
MRHALLEGRIFPDLTFQLPLAPTGWRGARLAGVIFLIPESVFAAYIGREHTIWVNCENET